MANSRPKPKDRRTGSFTKAGPNSRRGGLNRGKNGSDKLPPMLPTQPRYSEPVVVATPDTKQTFTDRLTQAIAKSWQSSEWSEDVGELVTLYVTSLIYGDGTMPGRLRTGTIPEEVVQQRFAVTCELLHIPSGVLPGQNQPWYPARRLEAKAFLTSRHRVK